MGLITNVNDSIKREHLLKFICILLPFVNKNVGGFSYVCEMRIHDAANNVHRKNRVIYFFDVRPKLEERSKTRVTQVGF